MFCATKSLILRSLAGPSGIDRVISCAFRTAFARSEEAFLAGLMHDIGKSVMAMKFPERYGSVIRTVYNQEIDYLQLELDTFGFDHAMVGEALLHAWNLATSMEHALRWHHEPQEAGPEYRPLAALVALGNQLALDQGVGLGRPEYLAHATEQAVAILGIPPADLPGLREQVLEALEMDKSVIKEL